MIKQTSETREKREREPEREPQPEPEPEREREKSKADESFNSQSPPLHNITLLYSLLSEVFFLLFLLVHIFVMITLAHYKPLKINNEYEYEYGHEWRMKTEAWTTNI